MIFEDRLIEHVERREHNAHERRLPRRGAGGLDDVVLPAVNTYNGVRIDSTSGTPQLINLNDYQNVGASAFIRVGKSFWVSLEYNYYLQQAANQHFVFVRLIYKTY